MLEKINLHLKIYSIINFFLNKTNNKLYLDTKDLTINKVKTKKINYLLFFVEPLNIYKYSSFCHLQFFNVKYLQCLYKINIKEKNINCLYSLPGNFTNILLDETESVNFKQFGIKYFNEVAFLFFINV
jgi:hypothetical protein